VGEVAVSEIRPNPRQPRHHMDPAELAELVASIREHGVLQPVVVTRSDDGEGYILIAGERRWSAAVQAGLERIPAVIKEATPQEMLELALVENLQRADLNPLEEAAAYQQLISDFGLTQERVAQRVGRSRPTVANSLRLLGLPDAVQKALAQGEISEGHARALLGASEPAEVHSLFLEVVSRRLSVRETEDLVRRRRTPQRPAQRATPTEDPEASRIEELFREALGTRVEVIRRGAAGRLIIHFYNDEQLQALYDALTHPSAEGL
jgi:ParB family chromosome partitioning protein